MDTCIFCQIAKHHISSHILYEDDLCCAFLDLSQTTDGHTLVIPKKHYQHFLDVDVDTLKHMMGVVQHVGNHIKQQMNAKGFHLVSNMNEVAGQSVAHFHIHIIPRYQEDDTFNINYTNRQDCVDLTAIYQRIGQLPKG